MFALAIIIVILHLAIGFVLMRKYSQTRDLGFIWLGIAVVAWPLMSRLIAVGVSLSIDRVIHHQSVWFPFNLIESGRVSIGSTIKLLATSQQLIEVVLLLVAVLYLARTKNVLTVAR